MSSKRAVSEIKKIRLESISITFSINFFLIYLLLKITNYKIHDIKIYGLKSLLIKNNVDKLGRIDKYYNQHDIEHWQ